MSKSTNTVISTPLLKIMHNFFHHPEYKVGPNLVNILLKFINDADPNDWKILYEFDRLSVPESILNIDPVLSDTVSHFDATKRIGIFRYPPNYAYKWHVDSSRNASINLLLTGYDSLCSFGTCLDNGGIENVTTLSYKEHSPVILNTSKYHTVINFSENRYLMSIGIPKPATFEDVVNYVYYYKNTNSN